MIFELLPIIARHPFIYFMVISGIIAMAFGIIASYILYKQTISKKTLRKAFASFCFFCAAVVFIATIYTLRIMQMPSSFYIMNVDSMQLVAIFIVSALQVIGVSVCFIREILRLKRNHDKKTRNEIYIIMFAHVFFQTFLLIGTLMFLCHSESNRIPQNTLHNPVSLYLLTYSTNADDLKAGFNVFDAETLDFYHNFIMTLLRIVRH